MQMEAVRQPTLSEGHSDLALHKAVRDGNLVAMERLGLALFEKDQGAGLPWVQKAALAGSARAALVLGIALFNGDGIQQDPAEGFAWIELAHTRGEAEARQALDQVSPLLSFDELTRGRERSRALLLAVPSKRAGPSGRVHVQLGSFSSLVLAKAAWAQISQKHGLLNGHAPSFASFHALTRLRIADLSAEQGAALCAALRRQGQACLLFR